MKSIDQGMGIDVPISWEKTMLFGRVVAGGMCSYDKLIDGTISIADFFEMHRMLDWREYCQAKAMESKK